MKKLFAFIIVIGVATFFWYRLALRPVNAEDQVRAQVRIEKGMSTGEIADLLEEEGIIRSSSAFNWYARFHRSQSGLQAGTFFLRPSMSVSEVIEALSRGYAEEASITIPEGFTVKDIDALLAEKGIAEAGAITACAQTCDFSAFTFLPDTADLAERGGKVEGYLYPDTYFVSVVSFDPKAFLERLLTTFEQRVVDGLAADIAASGRTVHEVVTMATMVEEETRTSAERPMVSGILWKRLDNGIGLGVDATVRYILEKPTSAITRADLDVDSPYNTRKYRGLPPGPIANAGIQSIKAALNPEVSEYFYYLHGNDGQIRYARTNDEHNANRARYLQ